MASEEPLVEFEVRQSVTFGDLLYCYAVGRESRLVCFLCFLLCLCGGLYCLEYRSARNTTVYLTALFAVGALWAWRPARSFWHTLRCPGLREGVVTFGQKRVAVYYPRTPSQFAWSIDRRSVKTVQETARAIVLVVEAELSPRSIAILKRGLSAEEIERVVAYFSPARPVEGFRREPPPIPK